MIFIAVNAGLSTSVRAVLRVPHLQRRRFLQPHRLQRAQEEARLAVAAALGGSSASLPVVHARSRGGGAVWRCGLSCLLNRNNAVPCFCPDGFFSPRMPRRFLQLLQETYTAVADLVLLMVTGKLLLAPNVL